MAIRSTAILCALLLSTLALGCGGDDDGGGPAVDAAVDPRCIVGDGEPIPFMCPCDLADDQCDTAADDMCFNFNEKGPHCTHACDGAEDCPEPSNDCNNMGVCKAPD
ncbi:MAG TPA: hypothetical protein VIG06_24025 [Kofleriaceae bacterium]|jgi:hypothetical protein